MLTQITTFGAAAVVAVGLALSAPAPAHAQGAMNSVGKNGVVSAKSAYSMEETVARLKGDIAAKGIVFFSEIDQAKLADGAGIKLRPSTLLIFGNPPLGTQFITAKPEAGLDWPVRLLVHQDDKGQVWTSYTDFGWIARRHAITSRGPQFKMASEVIASITSSVAAKTMTAR